MPRATGQPKAHSSRRAIRAQGHNGNVPVLASARVGSASSVNRVEVTSPPIITIASGRSISVPCMLSTQQAAAGRGSRLTPS